jgi:hypothetical protein
MLTDGAGDTTTGGGVGCGAAGLPEVQPDETTARQSKVERYLIACSFPRWIPGNSRPIWMRATVSVALNPRGAASKESRRAGPVGRDAAQRRARGVLSPVDASARWGGQARSGRSLVPERNAPRRPRVGRHGARVEAASLKRRAGSERRCATITARNEGLGNLHALRKETRSSVTPWKHCACNWSAPRRKSRLRSDRPETHGGLRSWRFEAAALPQRYPAANLRTAAWHSSSCGPLAQW